MVSLIAGKGALLRGTENEKKKRKQDDIILGKGEMGCRGNRCGENHRPKKDLTDVRHYTCKNNEMRRTNPVALEMKK